MTGLEGLVARAMVASSYLTLAVADPSSADGLTAVAYASAVAGVALHDVWRRHVDP